MDYKPTGVCSRLIHVELDGDKIANVEFVGGCAGNTSGISSLVKGMDAHEMSSSAWKEPDVVKDRHLVLTPSYPKL